MLLGEVLLEHFFCTRFPNPLNLVRVPILHVVENTLNYFIVIIHGRDERVLATQEGLARRFGITFLLINRFQGLECLDRRIRLLLDIPLRFSPLLLYLGQPVNDVVLAVRTQPGEQVRSDHHARHDPDELRHLRPDSGDPRDEFYFGSIGHYETSSSSCAKSSSEMSAASIPAFCKAAARASAASPTSSGSTSTSASGWAGAPASGSCGSCGGAFSAACSGAAADPAL